MLRRRRQKSNNQYVIYPEYFDVNLSRAEGRRISRNKAVENPSINKLSFVSSKLKLNYTVQKDKYYSKRWWNRQGRIIVEFERSEEGVAEFSKTEVITKIAALAQKAVSKKKELTKAEEEAEERARRRTKSAKR
ncbi:MAG: signal recognition particle subunit SRP19/SEC65 family protein [Candidatus Heimdallarchaeota archaeon]|nr:signal recognition particle subunit SRP19/SEC65 family protein [Candidatus Heimdallarchaeota archaeon]MCK5049117.1 signal recognition particle subunit SRP19/SEC65 family protein [Candidatus Heimdallarchaeota archaeon]